jgi:hypothetical protein
VPLGDPEGDGLGLPVAPLNVPERMVAPAVGAQAKSALSAAFENDLSDRRAVNVDGQRRADREVDLINLNLELDAAAVKFELRKTGRQDAVDRAAGKSGEQIAAVR